MEQTNLPTQTGWFSVELPGYRPGDGTYDFYAYDSLPPLPTKLFNGTLAWLKSLPEEASPEDEDLVEEDEEDENEEDEDEDEDEDANEEDSRDAQARIQKLNAQAQSLGLVLPPAFLRLMGSPELQDNVPSCTACEFQPVETILPHPGVEHGYILRFLNDQQDVLLWYLYLTPTGEHCVLVSSVLLEELGNPDYVRDPARWDSAAIARNTYVCALSFEEFIYRFWLENTLWFRLNATRDLAVLTDEERRYLSYYAPVA